MENNSLQGCSVVVTRPQAQAQGLAERIRNAGGQSILFPVLTISESSDKSELDKLVHDIAHYSILILISPNAVNYGLGYLLQHTAIPASCKIATVGKGSAVCAKKLLQHDIDIVPNDFNGQSGGYNTESLLTLPELQSVDNKKIAILRGNGGRELLGNTLRERGALIRYITTYTRSIPDDENNTQRLNTLIALAETSNALCVTMTSGESLNNFILLLENHSKQWLAKTQLVVINERLVSIARELGFKKTPLIARNASDQALVDCVTDWYQKSKQ